MPDEPLAVRPREIPGAHGDDAALLEKPQGVQGTGASFSDGGVIPTRSR